MKHFVTTLDILDSVKHHARQFGVSKYGLGRTFKVVNDLLLILFKRKFLQKPIYFFGSIGLFLFGIGTLISFYFLFVKLMGEDIWGRPLLILAILLVVVGVQFFSIGILYDLLVIANALATPYKGQYKVLERQKRLLFTTRK